MGERSRGEREDKWKVERGGSRKRSMMYAQKKKLGKKFFLLYFLPLGGDSTGLKSIFDT